MSEINDEKPEITMTDGSPVTPDHRELKPDGQQKGYVVLSQEERAKGFVRPVRRSYVHIGRLESQTLYNEDGSIFAITPSKDGCGALTTMSIAIAETYARDPKFYSHTFCVGCGKHLPVNEFIWEGTDQEVGS